MTKHLLYIIILLYHSGCDVRAQQVPLVKSPLTAYNLKGPVKEIRVRFDRNYPLHEVPMQKKNEYEFKNFWQVRDFPMGKWRFDEMGFVLYSQSRFNDDSTFYPPIEFRNKYVLKWRYDQADYLNKKELLGSYKYVFPIFDPYSIYVNHSVRQFGKEDSLNFVFKYSFNDASKVIESVKLVSNHIRDRSSYVYEQGDRRIIKKEIIYDEEVPDKHRWTSTAMADIGPGYSLELIGLKNAFYSFEYDSINRITLVKLANEDYTFWQEKYFYESDMRIPFKLERFIRSGLTYEKHLTDNATEWYNQFGDPVKTEDYGEGGAVLRTRFYEYKYDVQNNWLKCDMYLEGMAEKTGKPTIVIHREIDYYE